MAGFRINQARINKLKRIALSGETSGSVRLRMLDLLQLMGDRAHDAMAEIATNGLTHSERFIAIEMLGKTIRNGGEVYAEAKQAGGAQISVADSSANDQLGSGI